MSTLVQNHANFLCKSPTLLATLWRTSLIKGFRRGGLITVPLQTERNAHIDPHFESIDLDVSCKISATANLLE